MTYGKSLALALLTLILAACNAGPTRTSDLDLDPIETARLKELLAGEQGATVLIDVRAPARFDEGHIPGAINIPLPQIVQGDARLADARNIVVYGAGWTDYLAPAGAKKLLALGYANVFDYRGGLEQWQADGGELASGQK